MVKKRSISILETAILEMGRLKGEGSFSPKEVIQWVFPESWVFFVPEVMEETRRLYEEGKLSVWDEEGLVPDHFLPQTLFKIKT